MNTLYSWSAKRAGNNITIEHSCGRITGILTIEARLVRPVYHADSVPMVVATHRDGREFVLSVATAKG